MQVLIRLILVAFVAVSPVYATGTLTFSNGWINVAPPTVKVLAGYVMIHNQGDDPLELLSAQSSAFEKIEFHNTVLTDGVASMLKQDTISIPAQSAFSFAPGGMHLMLFNKRLPLNSGDVVIIDFIFSNGKSVPVEFELGRGDGHEHHHH